MSEEKKPKPGTFRPGNPGKPKGAISWEKKKLADACRDLFERECPDQIIDILRSKNLPVKMRCIEWLAERAYGKAPMVVRHGLDPESPEGILLRLAGQTLPGSGVDEEGDQPGAAHDTHGGGS